MQIKPYNIPLNITITTRYYFNLVIVTTVHVLREHSFNLHVKRVGQQMWCLS